MKDIFNKKILKEAGVLLIAVAMILSTVSMSAEADVMNKLENDSNYVNPSSSQNMDSGDSLFLQLPHDPDEKWSMATTDAGAGYIMYENFWGVTEPIGDIHWWGLALKYTSSGWKAGNPDNLVFDIKFYADDPNRYLLPYKLVATFANIVPPVITGTELYYAGFEMYYFDGVELDPFVNLSEGWVSIYSKSGGQGEDWLLWASAKTGDGFSYQDGNIPIPGRYCDHAMELTGVPSKPPEKPETPDGPTEGIVGVEYMFFTSTTDPEGEQVLYWWDWGDGTPGEWTDPSDSGVMVHASHIWNASGDYEVRVKAKDLYDKKSEWSDPLMIHIVGGPILEIGNKTGLFKVSTVIRNIGDVNATRVDWSITLVGGIILRGKETTGSILCIPAGDEAKISSSLIFGFGKTVVTVTAKCAEGSSDTNTRNASVLFCFIFW